MIGRSLLVLLLAAAPVRAEDSDAPTLADGFARIQAGDHEAAAAIFERITGQDPENGRAWSLLGYCRIQTRDLDGAVAAYARALEFEDQAPRAMYNTGLAYALKGENDPAFEWLLKAKETGKVSLTDIGLDPDAATLQEDERYALLFPTEEEFGHPFVEEVTVLQEWRGEATGDQYGWIARNIGDADGDGIADVTTSAPTWGEDDAGKVYAYSSRSGKLLWCVTGRDGDQLGLGIEAAGDVNADGTPDVIAGGAEGNRAVVLSGKDGSVIHELAPQQDDEYFGRKVSDLGDWNGDGHDDVLVGAPRNDHAGEDAGAAYVFSGKTGELLLTLQGEKAGDAFGSAGAGWASGDSRFLVVGAPNAGEGNGGRAYVYTGLTTEPAFVIEADETGAQLGGMFVSVVGDVDADGVMDVYASDWANAARGRSTGRIFVHSGKTGERLLTLTGEAAGDGFGIGPADAGDVNGDGHDDLVVGAWQHGSAAPSGGKVYVYSGRDGALLGTMTGKVPGETFGFDATGMGDVDGDGTIDYLLTSAWSSIRGSRSGRMFLVSGKIGG